MTEQQKATKLLYYFYTIKDIAEGIDLDEIQSYLRMYKEAEMYDICAGIKEGIDFASRATIVELKEEIKELTKDLDYE